MSPCSDRRYENRKDSQRNHHWSYTRLELRLFCSTCASLSGSCCCRPSCPCWTLACTATVFSDGTVLERSSFRSSLLTSGTSAHSINSHTVLTWAGSWLWNVSGSATMLWMNLPFPSWLGSCRCSALRTTHSHPCGPPPGWWRLPSGAWSWCCCQVVLCSHWEVWEGECISTKFEKLYLFLPFLNFRITFKTFEFTFFLLKSFHFFWKMKKTVFFLTNHPTTQPDHTTPKSTTRPPPHRTTQHTTQPPTQPNPTQHPTQPPNPPPNPQFLVFYFRCFVFVLVFVWKKTKKKKNKKRKTKKLKMLTWSLKNLTRWFLKLSNDFFKLLKSIDVVVVSVHGIVVTEVIPSVAPNA